MPDDNSHKNQDSRTQIILALPGLFGTVGVALITNCDKFFPPRTFDIYNTLTSNQGINCITLTYGIGGEVLVARADCSGDRWYVNKYDKWYSPSSQ